MFLFSCFFFNLEITYCSVDAIQLNAAVLVSYYPVTLLYEAGVDRGRGCIDAVHPKFKPNYPAVEVAFLFGESQLLDSLGSSFSAFHDMY